MESKKKKKPSGPPYLLEFSYTSSGLKYLHKQACVCNHPFCVDQTMCAHSSGTICTTSEQAPATIPATLYLTIEVSHSHDPPVLPPQQMEPDISN